MKNENRKYDIVFWAHGKPEVDRFIPLMVSLKERGLKSLLFFQNYDFRDELSHVQKEMFIRYGLDAMDYSHFLRGALLLEAVTLFVKLFGRMIRVKLFHNKLRGLRTKLLKPYITEGFIRDIICNLGQTISFFDNLYLTKHVDYPYGSYYIKKISDEKGIKCLSITHGGSVYTGDIRNYQGSVLEYYKLYVPNRYEKWSFERQRVDETTKVLALGDPRFDGKWKNSIKKLFSAELDEKIKEMDLKKGLKILYLAPNIEALGKGTCDESKYQSLYEIGMMCRKLDDANLLIKPHPRYRDEVKIKKVMAKAGLSNFFILEDDPLVLYMDHIDYIVSPGTSALGDFLPEGYRKIIILDNFFPMAGVENIFKKVFQYFDSYEEFEEFIRKNNLVGSSRDVQHEEVLSFCREWIAGDREMDAIVSDLTDDIYDECMAEAGDIYEK